MIKTWDDLIPIREKSHSFALLNPYDKIFFDGEISWLENSIYYFLQCVYIRVVEDGFLLVVIHQNRIVMEKIFTSPLEAKIAFENRFTQKAWKKNVTPKWSDFFDPDDKWPGKNPMG